MPIVFACAGSHAPGIRAWTERAPQQQVDNLFGGYSAVRDALAASRPDVVYVRTPDSIDVNASWEQAAESGKWTGTWTQADGVTRVGGRYFAKWRKVSGQWLVLTEVFVPGSKVYLQRMQEFLDHQRRSIDRTAQGIDEANGDSRVLLAGLGLLTLALGTAAGWRITRSITLPLAAANELAARVADGNLMRSGRGMPRVGSRGGSNEPATCKRVCWSSGSSRVSPKRRSGAAMARGGMLLPAASTSCAGSTVSGSSSALAGRCSRVC